MTDNWPKVLDVARNPTLDAIREYRPPRKLVFIRIGLMVLGPGIGVAVLYVLYWFFVASQYQQAAEDWVAAARARGIGVDMAKMVVIGFPWAMDLEITAPKLRLPDARPRWSFSAPAATVAIKPWSFAEAELITGGKLAFRLAIAAPPLEYRGRAGRLSLRFPTSRFQGGSGGTVTLTMDGLDLRPRGLGMPLGAKQAEIAVTLPAPPAADQAAADQAAADQLSLRVRIRAAGLMLPGGLNLPMGTVVERLDLDARLMGPLPGAFAHDSLDAWRQAGGTVEIDYLNAAYGPLAVVADGTMALDGTMQPSGAFTARVQGFNQTITALREARLMTPGQAVVATIFMSALSRADGDGGRARITVPLTLQDRTVSMGPVALARLAPIAWPPTAPAPPGTAPKTKQGQ